MHIQQTPFSWKSSSRSTKPRCVTNTYLLELLFRGCELCLPHLLLLLHALLQVSQHPFLWAKPQLSPNLLQPPPGRAVQGLEALAYPKPLQGFGPNNK